jgi:hypothetical protein
MRFLAKDPAVRPQSATEVLGVLDGIMPASASTPPRRRQAALGATLAVLLIAGAASAYYFRSKSPPAATARIVRAGDRVEQPVVR